MSVPEEVPDVFDPTSDPRHRPAAELPGPDPDAPRATTPTADPLPPPPGEPVIAKPGAAGRPSGKVPADGI